MRGLELEGSHKRQRLLMAVIECVNQFVSPSLSSLPFSSPLPWLDSFASYPAIPPLEEESPGLRASLNSSETRMAPLVAPTAHKSAHTVGRSLRTRKAKKITKNSCVGRSRT